MFTGIIASVGRIVSIQPLAQSEYAGVHVLVDAGRLDVSDVGLGDSIAINGACMTAVAVDLANNTFAVDVSNESLSKTTGLNALGPVNLEKAMRLSDRLGGHLVSGHVDDVARIVSFQPIGESHELVVAAPLKWQRFLADKGSITLHGTSLTVNRKWVEGGEVLVTINLIPHTIANTVFQHLKSGDSINLEIDLLARYIDQLMSGAE